MVLGKVSLILACTIDGGIGYNDQIPWHIPEDLRKFKKITTHCKDPNKINVVIMGRKTWESIGKPLPNRLNIVVTSNHYYKMTNENVLLAHSISSALEYCNKPYVENIFIIGGTHLYNSFLHSPELFDIIDKIYVSMMFANVTYDTNRHIDMDSMFKYFRWYKDIEYKKETADRLFASYICIPSAK